VLQHLEGIQAAVAAEYDPGKTGDLLTGMLSLRLGRYRERFAAHFARTLAPNRSLRALLFFAALYHDVSKPATRSVDESGRVRFFGHDRTGAEVAAQRAHAFRLSNDEIRRIKVIVSNHMRFHFHSSRLEDEQKLPSRRSIYRFFRDAGDAGADLILLGLADLRGTRGPTLSQETWSSALDVARVLLEHYWEKPEEAVTPPQLVDGSELMTTLGIGPGPTVGEALRAIREAQAAGEITSREQALDFARAWLRKNSS
jgi:putative nucleotidyltransferase with HDIG domain